MIIYSSLARLILFLSSVSIGNTSHQFPQWCEVDKTWIAFDPSVSICFSCKEATRIVTIEDAERLICCYDGSQDIVAERSQCQDWPRNVVGIACNNGRRHLDKETCDGYNHCGDGSDEKSCEPDCFEKFRCSISNRTQCFSTDKVCDGFKDCLEGSDEINCLYYNGLCTGFRCTEFHECVDSNTICDGVKNCLDGSDEQGCVLGKEGPFFCQGSAVESYAMSSVCNGSAECGNELDETNCWIWAQWSSWSECDCKSPSTQLRNRTCITASHLETLSSNCGNGSVLETQQCECIQSTTEDITTQADNKPLQEQWIIVISLSGLVLLFATVGMVYGAWYNKNAKEAMEKQMQTVTSIYNHTSLSLSPPSVVLASQQPTVFFPPSPHPTRPTIRRPDEALPVTPLEVINHTYESIEALRQQETQIDPYAQTGFPSPDDQTDGVVTVVQTYQISPRLSQDGYPVTPPPIPEINPQPAEHGGYLVPTFSQNQDQKVAGTTKGLIYAKMKSPTKNLKKRNPVKLSRSRIQSQQYQRTDNDLYTAMNSAHRAFSSPSTPVHYGKENNKGRSKPAVRRVKSAGHIIDSDSKDHKQEYSFMERSMKLETNDSSSSQSKDRDLDK